MEFLNNVIWWQVVVGEKREAQEALIFNCIMEDALLVDLVVSLGAKG